MAIYEMKFKIPYQDSDMNKKVRPDALLKYLSEISARHGDGDEYSSRIARDNYGWMLNKWKVRIDHYPESYEEIRVRTWISKVSRFFVNREFLIIDAKDREILRATALWIFIDLDRRIPIRLTEEYIDMEKIIEDSFFDEFIRTPASQEFDEAKKFQVRRSDLDSNRHVNNVNYFIWMLESVEDEIYINYKLREFEIDYKSEVLYPSEILTLKKNYIENDLIKIVHCIDNGEKNAFGHSLWKKS